MMEPPWQPDYSPPTCSRLLICRTLTIPDCFHRQVSICGRRRIQEVQDRTDAAALPFRRGLLPDLRQQPEAGPGGPTATIWTGVTHLSSHSRRTGRYRSVSGFGAPKVKGHPEVFRKTAFSCLLLSASCQTQLCRVSVRVLTVPQARTSTGRSASQPSLPAFLSLSDARRTRFSFGSSCRSQGHLRSKESAANASVEEEAEEC